jgi:hypothetical protein
MLLPLLLVSALHLAPADTLTGTWKITGDVMGNPLNEVCTLKQSGDSLSGSCKNADANDAKAFDVTGEVKDGKITFRHGGDYQGQALTITYSGTLAAARTLKGSVDVQPYAVTGDFTATSPSAVNGPTKP